MCPCILLTTPLTGRNMVESRSQRNWNVPNCSQCCLALTVVPVKSIVSHIVRLPRKLCQFHRLIHNLHGDGSNYLSLPSPGKSASIRQRIARYQGFSPMIRSWWRHYPLVIQHSHWTCWFIANFPLKMVDLSVVLYSLPEAKPSFCYGFPMVFSFSHGFSYMFPIFPVFFPRFFVNVPATFTGGDPEGDPFDKDDVAGFVRPSAWRKKHRPGDVKIIGKPWENHRKTIGKMMVLWDLMVFNPLVL